MGRHGRQQLLSRFSSKKSGQAIVELLPAVIIFFTVVVAALNYFRVMRSAVIRQEAVRNAAFALINNSGTLTTPPNLLDSVTGLGTRQAGITFAGTIEVPVISNHTFISGQSKCFYVMPPDPTASIETKLLPMFAGSGGTPSVKITTHAVVNRQPAGGSCAQ